MSGINVRRLYGTLDLLILKTLSIGGPQHGAAIADAVLDASVGEIQIEEGALYPALHRLQRAGYIEGEWRTSTKKYRAKFYTLTPKGKKELIRALREWRAHTEALGRVFEIGWEEAS